MKPSLRRVRVILRAQPFGYYACAAANNAVAHGMPFDHALTDGDLRIDTERSGFLINTEFGVLGISPTSGPTYSNTGRPGRKYTLCPGLLPALESWVMTDADGHDPMSRRSTRLIPYAAKESQACSQPLNIGTPFLGTRVRGHRLANARARCPRPTCEHSHTRL